MADSGERLGTLTIKDRSFDVTQARFWATSSADESLLWDFVLSCGPERYAGVEWSPSLRGADMPLALPPPEHLMGAEARIPSAYDEQSEVWFFTLHVFEHEDVYDCVLRFVDREGGRFRITLEAKCDLHWDAEYWEDLPLRVDGDVMFLGVRGS